MNTKYNEPTAAGEPWPPAGELAKAIAQDLFTMHGEQDVLVERIALMKMQEDGTERNVGGLCRAIAVATIEKQLQAYATIKERDTICD